MYSYQERRDKDKFCFQQSYECKKSDLIRISLHKLLLIIQSDTSVRKITQPNIQNGNGGQTGQ